MTAYKKDHHSWEESDVLCECCDSEFEHQLTHKQSDDATRFLRLTWDGMTQREDYERTVTFFEKCGVPVIRAPMGLAAKLYQGDFLLWVPHWANILHYALGHGMAQTDDEFNTNDWTRIMSKAAREPELQSYLLSTHLMDDEPLRYHAVKEVIRVELKALTEEDFGYTWEWFQGVRDLYQRAATEGRFVLFTADQ